MMCNKFLSAGIFILAICFLNACSKDHKTKATYNSDILGVDISHHNGDIDFNLLKTEGAQFVYIKSTEGVSLVDKRYKQNVKEARSQNLKVGAYHFFIFTESGAKQASHFLNNTEIISGDLIPVVDIEYSKNNPQSNDSSYFNKIKQEVNIFSDLVEQNTGKRAIIYCNSELYNKLNIPDSKQKYWIVDLKKEPTDSVNWVLWQFEHNKKVKNNLYLNWSKIKENSMGMRNILLPY